MASSINITLSGFDELEKELEREPQRAVEAMLKAHTKVATLAVAKLKQGLGNSGSERDKKAKGNFRRSKKGEMPRKHTGALQRSIYFKNLAVKDKLVTQIGSGVGVAPIEYAKYLEGRNHDGLRPFLWYIDNIVTTDRVIAYFDKYYKPLSGAGGK